MAAFELNLDVVEHQTECGNYEILYQEEGFNDSNFEFVDVQETKPFFKKKKKFKPKIKFGVPQTSKPFACEKCPYRAKNKGSLKKHQLTHSKEKPFRCPICEKGLKSKMALIHHVNSHKGNKPHACRYCDARFTSQSGMTRHVKYIHTGKKKHHCKICGYACVEKSKLQRHMLIHTGERPFQCQDCAKAFKTKMNLKRHQTVHTGEKPYQCEVCDKRFTQQQSLNAHRVGKHLGIYPSFVCKYCNKSLRRRSDLTSHIAHQHSYLDEALRCKHCPEEFTDRYSYNVHRRIHAKPRVKKTPLSPRASKRIDEVIEDVIRRANAEDLNGRSDVNKSKARKAKIKVMPKKRKVKNKSVRRSRRKSMKMSNCDKCHKKHLKPCGKSPKSPEVEYNCDFCRKSFKRLKNFRKHKCLENPEPDPLELNEVIEEPVDLEDTLYEEVEEKIFFKITSFLPPDKEIVDCLEVRLNENPEVDFNENQWQVIDKPSKRMTEEPLENELQVEEEQPAIEYDNVELEDLEEMGWLTDVLKCL